MSTPKWNRWLTVNNGSFLLMLQYVIHRHESTADSARSKIAKDRLEKFSQLAALVSAIAQEVVEQHVPLPRLDIERTFIDGFIKGDPNLLMFLENAITDGDTTFDYMSLPVLSDVVIAWRKQSALGDSAMIASPVHMKVVATELEEHEFKLWKLRANVDTDLYVSWCKVMKDRATQMYYKKIHHNNYRAAECISAARSLLTPSHKNCCVTLVPRTDEASLVSAVAEVKQRLMTTLVIDATDVFTLCYVNWTAMSLFNVKMISLQHSAFAHLVVNADANSLGLALMPTHTYRRGSLHKSISEAQDSIAKHGLNIDRTVCLHFSRNSDARNERPLLIIGSVVLPSGNIENKDNKLVKCIAKNPVICLGEQPRVRDMVTVDDPNIDALPPSIEVLDNPNATEKHAQLGNQACGKILNACIDDLASGSDRHAVLLVDLSVHVGDMLKAVASTASSRPLMCVGLCESADTKDFVESEIMHFLKTKLLADDGFKIPSRLRRRYWMRSMCQYQRSLPWAGKEIPS
jgi:hypothetical protein